MHELTFTKDAFTCTSENYLLEQIIKKRKIAHIICLQIFQKTYNSAFFCKILKKIYRVIFSSPEQGSG